MLTTIQRSKILQQNAAKVRPSKVDPATAKPFTLAQELESFGTWVSDPIWVPPKDSSTEMAESMLRNSSPFASRDERWSSVVEEHRTEFTQVREIELGKASIRLPQGKLFVSVTEREHFDQITDAIPNCVPLSLFNGSIPKPTASCLCWLRKALTCLLRRTWRQKWNPGSMMIKVP